MKPPPGVSPARLDQLDRRIKELEERLEKQSETASLAEAALPQVLELTKKWLTEDAQLPERLERSVRELATQKARVATDERLDPLDLEGLPNRIADQVQGAFVAKLAEKGLAAFPDVLAREITNRAMEAAEQRLKELDLEGRVGREVDAFQQSLQETGERLAEEARAAVKQAIREFDYDKLAQKVALQATGPVMEAIDGALKEADLPRLSKRVVKESIPLTTDRVVDVLIARLTDGSAPLPPEPEVEAPAVVHSEPEAPAPTEVEDLPEEPALAEAPADYGEGPGYGYGQGGYAQEEPAEGYAQEDYPPEAPPEGYPDDGYPEEAPAEGYEDQGYPQDEGAYAPEQGYPPAEGEYAEYPDQAPVEDSYPGEVDGYAAD